MHTRRHYSSICNIVVSQDYCRDLEGFYISISQLQGLEVFHPQNTFHYGIQEWSA